MATKRSRLKWSLLLGNRFIRDRMAKAHVSHSQLCVGLHQGRYWKRQLSKARRRAWKQDGLEGQPNNHYETYCEYKGW